MNRTQPRSALFAVIAANLLGLISLQAANKTWSGAGTDGLWSSGANWGGTAPVNNDALIFSGSIQPNNTNNISSLAVNTISFGNGGFQLSGNTLTVNGVAPAFFTNSVGTNIISCPLILGAPGSKYFFIAPNTELQLAGATTNTAASGTSVGWLNLTNGGTVRILNSAKSTRGMDLFQGTVIVDGSSAIVDASADGIRMKPPTGSTVSVQITNNATFRVGGGGNFRMGHNGTGIGGIAGAGSLSRVDMSSGLLELYGVAVNIYVGDLVSGATSVFNQNGGLVWGSAGTGNAITLGNSAGADGTYNLNGGVLWIAQVKQGNAGAANATFNFNGGTLKPTGSSTTFMQGVATANILSGGAIIDTTNFDVAIGQALGGTGGLKKLGTGSLALTGSSSYTGSTIVSNGTLVLTTSSLNGGGSLSVADGATLSVTNGGGSMSVSSLTVGAAAASTLQFNFPAGNAGSASIVAGTLTGNGSITVNITGSGLTAGQFPLIQFTSGSGLANFHIGTVPPGVSATLVQTGSTLDLNITSVVKSLQWSGTPANNEWDTSSLNWLNTATSATTSYSQSGGFGDVVTFSSSGTTAIDLPISVTPVSITVDASAPNYSFTGAGKISGIASLTMNSFSPLTLGTVNDYSGGTFLNAGTIYVGANQALGTGPVTLSFGTLASDSTTARTLPNKLTQATDIGVLLGDTVNNGTLNIAGGFDLGGSATRTLNFLSDVAITGSLTNGGIVTKTGPGALIIKGNSVENGLSSQQQGDVLVDGGQLVSGNGWRLQNFFAGTAVHLVVTNGGLLRVAAFVNTGNLRIGLAGGDGTADNILDIASGTVDMSPTNGIISNNGVSVGGGGANDVVYLRAGGLLITRSLFGASPAGTADAHFMGGTIRALANDTGFITGLTNAFMEDGGLTIDTTNFSVTVPQALIAAGNGGLTKIGNGTLTLTGTNTYTGATIVNGGKLVLGPAHAATGGVTVNANATLAFLQSAPPSTVNLASLTIGGGTNSAVEAQLSVTNAPAGVITNLVLNGSVAVNVTGTFGIGQFPLFGYGTISGPGGLTLGNVPLGTVGSIVTNTANKTIDLLVTSISKVVWRGNVNGNWNTVTTNWSISGTPAVYAQGANVLFDDSATTANVTLTNTLTPSSVAVSNSTLNYQFGGAGSLSGSMSFLKDGTGSLAINTANTFIGNVNINGGTIVLGSATALGSSANIVSITNGGTLDIAALGLGAQPVFASGTGANGAGALANSGADQNDALTGLTLTGDTTIGLTGALGIRTGADADLGLVANGHKLTKIGPGSLNLNGGKTVAGLTNIWNTDLGDIDIQAGAVSFQRRSALGSPTNTITVEPAASLDLFSLNTSLPEPLNKVVLNNGNLRGSGGVGDTNIFGGPITLNGSSNIITIMTWVGTTGPTLLYLDGPISGSGGVQFSADASVIQLSGNNTYTGATAITNGTLRLMNSSSLAGSQNIKLQSGATLDVSALGTWNAGASQTFGGFGTVNGNLQANGPLAPGDSVGTLTVNGNLTIAGNLLIDVNKSLAQSNDLTTVSGALNRTGSGSVIISNLGPVLTVGDTFTLFNQPVVGGDAMSITGGGATWQNNLAVDGSIVVLSVSPTGPTNAEPISYTFTSGNLNLNWPTTGWRLQTQTNNLSTNWVDWPNSTTVNAVSIPINPTNRAVFFRLVYP